jgi:serine/threonine-protein kinase
LENDQQRLDAVIAEYLEAVDAGRRPDPQEWLSRFPELAGPLAHYFAEEGRLHGLLAPLEDDKVTGWQGDKVKEGDSTASLFTLSPCHPVTLSSSGDFGDYELLEEVARGGMGVVYRARHRRLNRIVALKCILAGRLASAEEVQRFRYEAELAAHLDHPHVVPIYEVGEQAGLPYFTMKFIEGGSLAQHAPRFRHDPTAAARLVATVARAVHHAHQRGLLHRDLKPGNVLLCRKTRAGAGDRDLGFEPGDFEPMLVDFGMARRLDGGLGLTASGTAVGTPSYMAPEQAAGGAVTTVADIYSLGAILYELLTGTPPFRGEGPLDTLRQVQEQEPVGPRSIEPKVPHDLETVCLKCLQKEPTRRYAAAEDLAEDLERFLRGEPIRGRRVGAAAQLWRWCRRRPVPAGLAAALILSVVAGLGLVTWQWRRAEANFVLAQEERTRAEEERSRAEEERARADEGFNEAHRAVQEFYTRVSEGKIRDIPGAQTVRRELLESALAYYERFLRERGPDLRLRVELAETHFRIARLASSLGDLPKAEASCRQAVQMYRELLRDQPTNAPLRTRLAQSLGEVGFIDSQLGKMTAALDSLAEARRVYEQLRREQPDDPIIEAAIASVLTSAATAEAKTGKVTAAIASLEQARTVREKLYRRSPGAAAGVEGLASCCLNLAEMHRSLSQREQASRYSRQALRLVEALVKADPRSYRYQHLLADGCLLLAALLPAAEGLPVAQRGHAALVRLCELEPGVVLLQSELAASHRLLGRTYNTIGRAADALAEHEKSLALMEGLVRQNPQVTDLRRQLGRSHFDRGHARLDLGQMAGALESFTAACDIRRALVKSNPESTAYRMDLASSLINSCEPLSKLGRKAEALEAARESVAIYRTVVAQTPKVASFRASLAHSLKARARFALENRRAAEAADTALELKKLYPGNGSELYEAAKILAHASLSARRHPEPAGQSNDADRYADLALVALREAVAAGLPKGTDPSKYAAFSILRGRPEFQEIIAGLPKAGPESRRGDGSAGEGRCP